MRNILVTGAGGLGGSHVCRPAVEAEPAGPQEGLRASLRRPAGPRAASGRAVVA